MNSSGAWETEFSRFSGQNHACWCTGSQCRQSISRHDIGCIRLKTWIVIPGLIPSNWAKPNTACDSKCEYIFCNLEKYVAWEELRQRLEQTFCNDVIMSATASQITSLTIVYSTVYSGADQRKHQRSASLAFVRGIHWWPVNSPYKGSVTRKMFPFDDDDVIKWKHFPRYWPFVRGIHRSPVNSPHKGQWREALRFSLICARINDWVNNREAGDLRRHRGHYDVSVMIMIMCTPRIIYTVICFVVIWPRSVLPMPTMKVLNF